VRIKWKEGMDPTKGLLDAACDLADAEKAVLEKGSRAKLSAEERMKLPKYEKLVEKVAQMELEAENAAQEDDEEGMSSLAGLSFFAWFGYRGKDVTADESKLANKEDRERWEKIANGEDVDDRHENEDDDNEDQDDDGLVDAEIFPDGEDLAIALGEDIWPNALKYYVQSYDVASDFDSDVGSSDFGSDTEDPADSENEESEDENERPRKKAKA
jgi:hypothetical protein